MTKSRAIADLSKNFRETERPSIALFKQFCIEQQIELADVTVVVRQDQIAVADELLPLVNRVVVRDYAEAEAKILRLLNARGPTATTIYVISYNRAVLELESTNPFVKASSFRSLRDGRSCR
jgi:hypothetical protein